MIKYLLIAGSILFLNSCKKDTLNINLVPTKWDLAKTSIISVNNFDLQDTSKDFNSNTHSLPYLLPSDLPFVFKIERYHSKPDTTFSYPVPIQIGSLTFTSNSDISITKSKEICTCTNYLDRVCTRNLLSTTGKYVIKNDSISLTIDNETKRGIFLSKDSLVVLTYVKFEYENQSNMPKLSNIALLEELYIRSK